MITKERLEEIRARAHRLSVVGNDEIANLLFELVSEIDTINDEKEELEDTIRGFESDEYDRQQG